ncbi:glycerol kinase 2 [Longispora fulva]|uniref:Glycerol kinase n=1 Tax=Longispora fulva TaxID=619741 RepID=A0A8J7H420_9ACTN|nr:glycerol kinase GlpK [Longispora fulva]MBG6140953.1 glycerol kinase [Longispora fulva]GIG60781.1 glycerol kinase 2 [Longispora fulva]
MRFVAAIDQGTTSSRCILFDQSGRVAAVDQREITQHYPRAGWVEHSPTEIWESVEAVVAGALSRVDGEVVALGITNQRETTVVWDAATGEPLHNALVWQDTRTEGLIRELAADGGLDRFRDRCGLPLATYFAGPKMRWLLDHLDLRERAAAGEVRFGTVDSWLLWKLTGRHITDVTNASRTMLMNLTTLDWDPLLLDALGVPRAALPEIVPSSAVYGPVTGLPGLAGVPVAAALGDQQAALFGQTCFEPGEGKNTYGTGSFLLLNTGTTPVHSWQGLLTTVACQLDGQPATYALEGSIAITGALVQWLRDNLELISSADEIEPLAASVPDTGGAYIVPAFSGLYAPHWRLDARGVIAGLTRFVTKAHLARAALEATAWQTREVADAMVSDAGVAFTELRVDGGMTANSLMMQIQSDILGVPVVRPTVPETTALGAAYAAGLAVGFWSSLDELRANWKADARWTPALAADARETRYAQWRKAVSKTLNWVD